MAICRGGYGGFVSVSTGGSGFTGVVRVGVSVYFGSLWWRVIGDWDLLWLLSPLSPCVSSFVFTTSFGLWLTCSVDVCGEVLFLWWC